MGGSPEEGTIDDDIRRKLTTAESLSVHFKDGTIAKHLRIPTLQVSEVGFRNVRKRLMSALTSARDIVQLEQNEALDITLTVPWNRDSLGLIDRRTRAVLLAVMQLNVVSRASSAPPDTDLVADILAANKRTWLKVNGEQRAVLEMDAALSISELRTFGAGVFRVPEYVQLELEPTFGFLQFSFTPEGWRKHGQFVASASEALNLVAKQRSEMHTNTAVKSILGVTDATEVENPYGPLARIQYQLKHLSMSDILELKSSDRSNPFRYSLVGILPGEEDGSVWIQAPRRVMADFRRLIQERDVPPVRDGPEQNILPTIAAEEQYCKAETAAFETASSLRQELGRQSPDKETISKLRSELRKHVEIAFRQRLESQQTSIEKTQKDLDAAKSQLIRRRELQQKIIDRRVEELENSDDLSWAAAGKERLPDLIGASHRDATERLQEMGIPRSQIRIIRGPAAADSARVFRVLKQEPAPGTDIGEVKEVTLTLSTRPLESKGQPSPDPLAVLQGLWKVNVMMDGNDNVVATLWEDLQYIREEPGFEDLSLPTPMFLQFCDNVMSVRIPELRVITLMAKVEAIEGSADTVRLVFAEGSNKEPAIARFHLKDNELRICWASGASTAPALIMGSSNTYAECTRSSPLETPFADELESSAAPMTSTKVQATHQPEVSVPATDVASDYMSPADVVREMYRCLEEEDWEKCVQLLTDDEVRDLCSIYKTGTFTTMVHLQHNGGSQQRQEALQEMIAAVDASVHGEPNPDQLQSRRTTLEEGVKNITSHADIDPASFDVEGWARRNVSRVRNPREFVTKVAPLGKVAFSNSSETRPVHPHHTAKSPVSVFEQGNNAVALVGREGDAELPLRSVWLLRVNGRWLISKLPRIDVLTSQKY